MEEDDDYERLEKSVTEIIYSVFPATGFTGSLQFIYTAPGQFLSRSGHIGTVMRNADQ